MLARTVSMLAPAFAVAIAIAFTIAMFATGYVAKIEGLLLTKGGMLAAVFFAFLLLERMWAYKPSIMRPDSA